MARWAGSSYGPSNALKLINQRLYPVGKGSEILVQMYQIEVGAMYKLNPVVTHSLEAPGFNP
jgi:hypothetical protein